MATSTEAERSLSFTLDKGDERYVRFEAKLGFFVGHINPVLVDKEVGRKEIEGTKFIGKMESK